MAASSKAPGSGPREYDVNAIEVLDGLDPVRKRPGMYTDTARPNHLAQEVIDNAVDEALGGYAKQVQVTLFADGSCEVRDDGRGIPTDIHPVHKISGVELVLTKLHAGGKFSNNNYQFYSNKNNQLYSNNTNQLYSNNNNQLYSNNTNQLYSNNTYQLYSNNTNQLYSNNINQLYSNNSNQLYSNNSTK